METFQIALAVALGATGFLSAEEASEKTIDLEARKRSLPIVEDHLREREERLEEIRSDLIRLDKRLEGRIDKIVAKLAGIKDSEASGFRVSQIKRDAMEGLGRTIARYQAKRRELRDPISVQALSKRSRHR